MLTAHPFRRAPKPALACLLLACAASPPASAAWLADGTPVCATPESQQSIAVLPDGSGGALFTWSDSRGGASGIYAQRVDSNGVALWTPGGVLVNTSARNPRNPVAIPFLGGAVIVWQESPGLGNADLAAQRIDLSGSVLWASGGVPIASSALADENAVVIGNGSSGSFDPVGFYVAWRQYDHMDPSDARTIVVKAVDSAGNPIWAAGEVVVSSPMDVPRGIPVLALDGTGLVGRARGVVVAWDEFHSGTSWDVYAQRVTSSGQRAWTSPSGIVSDEVYGQSGPAITQVGTNTVIAWTDQRSFASTDVYAQRLNSTGVSLWTPDGIPVTTASGSQFAPRVIADNAGGAIVVWIDRRSGDNQPYAQRLDTSGQRLWSSEGVPMCSAASGVSGVSMVSDGAGGAIVAWTESRNGGVDLYAQRVDASGLVVWAAAGVPLCTASGSQLLAGLTRSGSGVIAGWLDQRNGAANNDVYAMRAVGSTGSVGVSATTVTGSGLVLDSANPARGPVRLRLALAAPAEVSAEVLDVSGRRVRSALARATLGAGTHSLVWDGSDDRGHRAQPGLYLVRVAAGGHDYQARVVQMR